MLFAYKLDFHLHYTQMMDPFLTRAWHGLSLCIVIICFPFFVLAQGIQGTVSDSLGNPLGYASVYVKGGTKGTTTNADGKYSLDLPAGNYTITCAFIGYAKVERSVIIARGEIRMLDFQLSPMQIELSEVVVKAGAEDPAYAIMRKAIAKRKEHLKETETSQSTVYMKGLIRSVKVPKKILGQKVQMNNDIIDSTGKGIIYFSESLTRYSKSPNGKFKEEVISAKVSGNSSGFGFNSPSDLDVNFYENNIPLQGMNSRGFISPLHDNAFNFYKYKFLGSFYEDGREINKIAVIPKRQYEPIFAGGFINIIEGTWRLHSAQLQLSKASQMELVDSLEITQEFFDVGKDIWLPKYTRIIADFGILGFKANADFAAVFSDYSAEDIPVTFFKKNIIKSIDTSANKKTMSYWDSIRPIPLSIEERKDYVKKDSLEKKFKDPQYLDSLDRIANKLRPVSLLIGEQTFFSRAKKIRLTIPGVLNSVQYNTVEQWAVAVEPVFTKWSDTGSFTLSPRFRYNTGFNRLYTDITFAKRFGRDYKKRWDITVAGGNYMFQINPDNPILPLNNTIATLLYTVNHMKIFEKAYGRVAARKVLGSGFTLTVRASYEDRKPLENTDTTTKWRQFQERSFTPNYPQELPPGFFDRHQAFITGLTLRFQPGIQYIQYPNRLVSIGSDAPVFTLALDKAWRNVAGADANFGRWRLTVADDINMKLGGSLKYNLSGGGFINNDNVQLPDWQHFMGNQTIVASPFVRSFQLAPYYANSTKDNFFAKGHVEWHLNGLLTNKIPLFRRTNIGLVTGSNAFYVDKNRNYSEIFVGLENILKVFRVDYVWGWDGNARTWVNGVVIGFGGLLGGSIGD
jgi:hypothetical protein